MPSGEGDSLSSFPRTALVNYSSHHVVTPVRTHWQQDPWRCIPFSGSKLTHTGPASSSSVCSAPQTLQSKIQDKVSTGCCWSGDFLHIPVRHLPQHEVLGDSSCFPFS